MKKNTYPVAQNAQAIAYREIFKDDTKPGRVKGINNSPNLISLFPKSPFYEVIELKDNDRGNLLNGYAPAGDKPLTNDLISLMFENVVDGSNNNKKPHVLKLGPDSDFTDTKNYNWLYRDNPMDMNFNYLKPDAPNSNTFIKSSPDAASAPVGSNAPIPNGPDDKPFWGHANLQVPSINPLEVRADHDNKPQLQRGSGGFGTNYPISNRAFASQEKIGTYFANSYNNTTIAGDEGTEIDRMTFIAGKSIINMDNQNNPTGNNSDYFGDINPDGSPKTNSTT